VQRKKRVLIIGLTERMGGVETFIYNTTVFSDVEKYEYDFLVHGVGHCVFEDDINSFYNNGRHIYFIRKYKSNPIGCIYDLFRFYKKKGNAYDYIHLQTGSTTEILYVFPFCLFIKAKVISHSHNGNGYNQIINRLFRPVVNFVSKKKLACSSVAADWLYGKKCRDALIVNNGIDTTKFTFDASARTRIRNHYEIQDELVIGHIGRFSVQKNHTFIFEVFDAILKKQPKAKLMLVGVGELLDNARDRVKEFGIEKSVVFCGKQMDTPAYYSAFDIFLMPSLYEGLPIVGVEAQSEGLPCFFSSNVSEQIKITNNANVLSLDMKSSEWADQILKVKMIQSRGSYSDIIAEKGYSIQNAVKTLEKVYDILEK